MVDYSFFVLGDSSISISGGVTLSGGDNGDGRQLVGNTITLNSRDFTEVFVTDAGSETNFADNDGGQELNGTQVIDGETFLDGTVIEAEYQFVLVDDTTGIEYRVLAVNLRNSSPVFGTSEAIAFVDTVPPFGVPLRVDRASEGPGNSGGGAVDESEIVPVCFCRGTRIHTKRGKIRVQKLLEGDLVMRADGSWVPLRRIYRRKLAAADLQRNPKLRPVRIRANALGHRRPSRDLLVSRQHRMLVSSKIAERMFGAPGVLLPAIKLTDLPGVSVDASADGVEYFHLLFDAHEVIVAEGAPTEALFTGPQALRAIGSEARAELLALYPEMASPQYRPRPARPIPPAKRQRRLVRRHLKNAKPLVG